MSEDNINVSSQQLCDRAKNEFKTLNQQLTAIEKLIEDSEKKYLFHFIKSEVEKECKCRHNRVVQLVDHNYKNRFCVGDEILSGGVLKSHHIYNYGDLVYKTTSNEKCIVVKETQCYVWLWFFNMVTDDSLADKVKKNTGKYNVLKRCDINKVTDESMDN